MRLTRSLLLAAAGGLAIGLCPSAPAQVSFGVTVGGPPPVCPYGYYSYAPYNCSPYGYYGPEWFSNGAFIGAGPWFHGPRGFYGHVDRRFDPHYGYHGAYPNHGQWHEPPDHFHNFHGQDFHDGHGYVHHGDEHGGHPR